MDALPLELYEQIFEYLVPVYDVREIVTLPTYTKEQRQDIYNIRLTSRWLQRHSTLHFTRVIQDVPTGCMNLGMQKLASLAKTPGVGEKMTCLSLNGFAQVIVHKKSEDGDRQFRVVPEWLRESFPEILRKVLSDMPLIRDLVCIMNCLDWANTEAYNDGWSLCEQNTDEWLEKDSIAWLHELRSPLKIIQDAIGDSNLGRSLRSIALLRSPSGSWRGYQPWPAHSIASNADLEHLTFAASVQLRFIKLGSVPKLRTLHYIACEQPSISRGVYHLRYFTLDNLRELTISGAAPGHRCKPETILLAYMRPSGKTTFERLILKNIGMHADISWTLSETIIALVERCYIKTLIFDNVQYTLSDKITLSGPSDPKVISEKFKPFNVIAATARNVKIIQSSGMETWYKTDGLIHSASEAS